MPPPPPPSKSYSLVIEDDTTEDEEEEDDDWMKMTMPPNDSVRSTATTATTVSSSSLFDDPASNNKDDEISDDGDASSDDAPSGKKSSKKKKKNKKKKNNKKRKKKSEAATVAKSKAAAVAKSSSSPVVTFGNVTVLEYPRCLATDTVPADGGWPLGMQRQAAAEQQQQQLSLEEYQEWKLRELQQRWTEWKQKYNHNDDNDEIVNLVERYWETRQWDYKKTGIKNPLFRLLKEEERMDLLLDSSSSDNNNATKESSNHKDDHHSKHSSHKPPHSNHHRHNNNNKHRNHHGKGGHQSHSSSSKSHSSLNSSSSHHHRPRSHSFSERYNDEYPQFQVHHVRNELEIIRNSRGQDTGCTCRKLHVHLSFDSKKARSRRMNEKKLKEELRKRGLLEPHEYHRNNNREELERRLHDAVEREPCCWGDDCPCVRNGISCQADACACWYDSHNNHHNKTTSSPSIEEIETRCGNRNGMYAVDVNKIDEYRQQFYCQVIDEN